MENLRSVDEYDVLSPRERNQEFLRLWRLAPPSVVDMFGETKNASHDPVGWKNQMLQYMTVVIQRKTAPEYTILRGSFQSLMQYAQVSDYFKGKMENAYENALTIGRSSEAIHIPRLPEDYEESTTGIFDRDEGLRFELADYLDTASLYGESAAIDPEGVAHDLESLAEWYTSFIEFHKTEPDVLSDHGQIDSPPDTT